MSGKIKIIKPSKDGHFGDTFRELIDLWEKSGYVEVSYENTPHVWWEKVGGVLLYDRPIILHNLSEILKENIIFANTVPKGEQPWIFWARRPKLLEKVRSEPQPERIIKSIFLGKVENSEQLGNRNKHDWSKSVELFSMPVLMGDSVTYPYSQEEYLNLVRRSSYGLCLAGFGPKCNREIEYMGLGTVPLVTPEVDMTYYDPPIEGKHYLRIEKPEDINVIDNISLEKWGEMSQNCLDWYERNASPKGSFDTTMHILEESAVDY